jgi:hypothetical protein
VDNETREVLATFDDVDAHSQLDFSPDGSLLVAGGTKGLVTLIDPVVQRTVGAPLRGVDGPVVSQSSSALRRTSSSVRPPTLTARTSAAGHDVNAALARLVTAVAAAVLSMTEVEVGIQRPPLGRSLWPGDRLEGLPAAPLGSFDRQRLHPGGCRPSQESMRSG